MKRTHSNRTLARQARISAISLALGALFIGGSMSAAAAPPEELEFDMASRLRRQIACGTHEHT